MDDDEFRVQLLTTPVALALATLEYGDAVVREVALLALDGSELVHTSEWSIPTFDISPLLDERGAGPEAWELPDHFAADRAAAELTDADRERFESVTGGAVVADDSNRIVLVNDRAAELLGWDASDLIGYRLVQIIPPDLRAAHLAGFTRLTFTGESRLLGQPVDVAALRRDGSTVDIRLTIEGLAARGGRTAYLAQIEPG